MSSFLSLSVRERAGASVWTSQVGQGVVETRQTDSPGQVSHRFGVQLLGLADGLVGGGAYQIFQQLAVSARQKACIDLAADDLFQPVNLQLDQPAAGRPGGALGAQLLADARQPAFKLLGLLDQRTKISECSQHLICPFRPATGPALRPSQGNRRTTPPPGSRGGAPL